MQSPPTVLPRGKRAQAKPPGWINYSQTILEKASRGRG